MALNMHMEFETYSVIPREEQQKQFRMHMGNYRYRLIEMEPYIYIVTGFSPDNTLGIERCLGYVWTWNKKLDDTRFWVTFKKV